MADPNTDNKYPIAAATSSGVSLGNGFTATVSPPEVGTIATGVNQPPTFVPSALGGPFTITVTAGGRAGQLVGTVTVEPLVVTLGDGIPK